MSKLFYTERGRTNGFLHEELSQWRHAKKVLNVPAAAASAPATAWVLAIKYADSSLPMRVAINGVEQKAVQPLEPEAIWQWVPIEIKAGTLKAGDNSIVLWCDSPAMNAWAIGIDATHPQPESFISIDAGQTWRNDAMGAHHAIIGEYIVRIRSHAESLRDGSTPGIVYGDADHPRMAALREIIPAAIRDESDPWRQTLALREFVCAAWDYHGGQVYAPWDPMTILDWGKANRGHNQKSAVTFCVHYGATFVALATVLGRAARCVAVTGGLNSYHGHFMAEVWDERMGKWVLHDPTIDAHFEQEQPLSLFEIADLAHAGQSLVGTPRTGPAHRGPTGKGMIKTIEAGKLFDLACVWLRNDYVSDPAIAPPAHGQVIYCETDFLWYTPKGRPVGTRDASMFPYRASDRAVFDAAPPQVAAVSGRA
jgi:hypothetical protein